MVLIEPWLWCSGTLNPNSLITTRLCRSCANVTQDGGAHLEKQLNSTAFLFCLTILCFIYVLYKKIVAVFNSRAECYISLVNNRRILKSLFWLSNLYQAWHSMTGYFSGKAQ
jgi:hypothetical protein